MKMITLRKGLIIALGFGALIVGFSVYAATSVTIADGVYANFEEFGGPAKTRMRTLTIPVGEDLPWHYHAGVGALTIVKQGTLTVEDGCGFNTDYTAGQAFVEPAGRVHRGRNLGTQEIITAQTFIVPLDSSFSANTVKACGRPLKVDECKNGGWQQFDYPRTFNSQGDCIQFVRTGN